MKCVALIGPQGSGKTSLARMLQRRYGYIGMGIAEPIKEIAGMAYPGLDKREMLTLDTATGHRYISGRQILQEVGGALRQVDPLFWLRIAAKSYKHYRKGGHLVVIDDLRLAREADYLAGEFPELLIVAVYASDEQRAERLGKVLGSWDVTETDYVNSRYDFAIDTTGMTTEDAFSALLRGMEDHA